MKQPFAFWLSLAAVFYAATFVAYFPDTVAGFIAYMCVCFFSGAGAHAVFGDD